MGYVLSILFFLAVFPLLGWSFLQLIKLNLNKHFLESYLICLGVGLGIFPLLTVVLNFLNYLLPVNTIVWWFFLALSLVVPVLNFKRFKINFGAVFNSFKDVHFLLMLVIFFVLFGVMLKGAFVYPYLEDDDAWAHALSAKYVAVEKNLKVEPKVLAYLNPYPPAYPALMGIIHQTNNSIYLTLKFFNALIVALTIPFFYLFANLLFNHKTKALFATFVLASLPSFLSHFIWAPSLAMLLIIIALYWMVYFAREKSVLCQSSLLAVLIAGIFLTQITHAIKFSIFFLGFFVISCIIRKNFNLSMFLSGSFGLVLSLFWWGSRLFEVLVKTQASAVAKGKGFILANNIGTGSRAYELSEFLFPSHQGLMTNPIGVGLVVSLLAIIGIIVIVLALILKWKILDTTYKETSIFTIFAAIFTFLGVNSVTFNLPIGLFAFRFWMFLSIPVTLLSVYGLLALIEFCRRTHLSKTVPFIVLLCLVGIIFTSAYPKYSINTSFWSQGVLYTVCDNFFSDEFYGTLRLRDSVDLKLFPICKNGFKKLIGNDQFSCAWCRDELDFQKNFLNKSSLEIYNFLKLKGYEGLFLDVSCIGLPYTECNDSQIKDVPLRINKLITNTNELINSGLFTPNQNHLGLVILNMK